MLNEHDTYTLLIEINKKNKLLAYFVKLTGKTFAWEIMSEIAIKLVTNVHSRTGSRATFL